MDDILIPSQILLIHCPFTTPPKDKFLLLISRDVENFSFFVINSQINQFIRKRTELYKCQVLIKKITHNFLNHDSYINCSEIRKIHGHNVLQQIKNDKKRIKGFLHYETGIEVLAAVKSAVTIAELDKKLILESLETLTKAALIKG